MKKLKMSIFIVIVIIIIVTIALLIVMNKKNITDNIQDINNVVNNEDTIDKELIKNNVTFDEEEIKKYEKENAIGKVRYEDSSVDFFTVTSIIERYLYYLGTNENDIIKDIVVEGYSDKLDSVPEISSYKQSINILLSNIIKARVDENKYIYIVDTDYRLSTDIDTHSIKVMVGIDYNNRTYRVFPMQYIIDKGLNNIKVGDNINYTLEDIKQNDNNSMVSAVKNDLEIANILFEDLKERFRYYLDKVYEKLDVKYAQERFKYQNSFTEYLQDNKTYFSMMTLDKYKVNTKDEYKEYICADKYGNIYIFKLSLDNMQYTVLLDDYTIKSEEDIKSYNNLDLQDKSTYNARTLIKMINNKDYYHIYDLLDDTFKSNNFKSVNDLKEYLKANLYDQNEISTLDNKKENDCYVIECNIINKKATTKSKKMTIIIKLEDEDSFTMSFSFE